MTFQDHLDRLLKTPTAPPPTVLPDDGHHDWFVASHTLRALSGLPVAQAIAAQPRVKVPHSGTRRVWSERQDEALDALRGLGARLDREPTLAAVRHAWRQLARALHPDLAGSHDTAGDFATAAGAWRVLQDGPAIELGDGTFRAGL